MGRFLRYFTLIAVAVDCTHTSGASHAAEGIIAANAASQARDASAVSPHWPHARTMVADYRIQYIADAATRAREYEWTAAHFDRVVLDRGDTISVPEYRRRNPRIALYRYALLWTVTLPGEEKHDEAGVSYLADMERWYAAHPRLDEERAFLHDARRCPPPSAITPACRVQVKIWTQQRWVTNPGDSAARAYHASRLAALASDADGIFVDEHGSGDFDLLRDVPLREYAQWSDYQRDVTALVGATRRALGSGKILLLNTAEWHTPWDAAMIAAGGGTHGEHMIDPASPQTEERWRFLERLIDAGLAVDVSPKHELPASYDAGNSASAEARAQLFELASYYLLISGAHPDAAAFNPAPKWDRPYAERWVGGIEGDLGAPVGERTIGYEVNAPVGKGRARVWMRELGRAVVLVRPAGDDPSAGFGDATGVVVPFVKGEVYRPLAADGSVGAPLQRLVLRAGEAAILLKPGAAG